MPEKTRNVAFDIYYNQYQQQKIIAKISNERAIENPNNTFVFVEFPEFYTIAIQKLLYPENYMACFMSDYKNSTAWGHYSAGHKGVCLVFKSEIDADIPTLPLITATSWSSAGAKYEYAGHEFKKVDYINGFSEIDFFNNLGNLPAPTIDSEWYCYDGVISSWQNNYTKNKDLWRAKYWEILNSNVTVKSKDWDYELEHRIIIVSSLNSYQDSKDRLLKYNFKNLHSIIFGINISEENKLKVLKIIDNKCFESKRKDFKFYQAYYSHEKKCIEKHELSLLKITP